MKLKEDTIEEMKRIHFIADLHHGHPKIVEIHKRPIWVKYEGEKSPRNKEYVRLLNEAHTEWLVKEVINPWVKKGDTMYMLGDVSMAKRADAEKFLDRLNGKKFLIIGNHDKNIQNSTRFVQTTIRKDFTFLRDGINLHIVLDHYPMLSWNRRVHGSWQLYGHVHGTFKVKNALSFDVGLDNQELRDFTGGVYRPLNLYEIVQIMQEKMKTIPEWMLRSEKGEY